MVGTYHYGMSPSYDEAFSGCLSELLFDSDAQGIFCLGIDKVYSDCMSPSKQIVKHVSQVRRNASFQ